MTKSVIIDRLVDAISSSGKTFNQISKENIYQFLNSEKIDKSTWPDIYEKLSQYYNSVNKVGNINTQAVDYGDSSHNDVKVRQPKKSVFSEIKKIAG